MNETATTALEIVPEIIEGRLGRARELDRELRSALNQYARAKLRCRIAVYEIREQKLWRELGYKNWTHYVLEVTGEKLQTINNWYQPCRRLIQGGVEPETIVRDLEGVSDKRINDVSLVIEARGGRVTDEEWTELVQLARAPRTRRAKIEQAPTLDELADDARDALHMESVRTLQVYLTESLHLVFKGYLALQAEVDGEDPYVEEFSNDDKARLIERALAELGGTPEFQRAAASLAAKRQKQHEQALAEDHASACSS